MDSKKPPVKAVKNFVYLYTGDGSYRFVGYEWKDGHYSGYDPRKGDHVTVTEHVRRNWDQFEIVEFLFPGVSNVRTFATRVYQNPRNVETAVLILYNVGIKVLLLKDCKALKADVRRAFEHLSRDIELVYRFEGTTLIEEARIRFDTSMGWAQYFTRLCQEQEISCTIESTSPFPNLPEVEQPVFWEARLSTIEQATFVTKLVEQRYEADIRFMHLFEGFAKPGSEIKPLIAQIGTRFKRLYFAVPGEVEKYDRQILLRQPVMLRLRENKIPRKPGTFNILCIL